MNKAYKEVYACLENEYNSLTLQAQETLDHGFAKMMAKENFRKMINDILEKFQSEASDYFDIIQRPKDGVSYADDPISILGISPQNYGLPKYFDKEIDFLVFSCGLAEILEVVGVDICITNASDVSIIHKRFQADKKGDYVDYTPYDELRRMYHYKFENTTAFSKWIHKKCSYGRVIFHGPSSPGALGRHEFLDGNEYGGERMYEIHVKASCLSLGPSFYMGSIHRYGSGLVEAIRFHKTAPSRKITEDHLSWYN